MKTFCMTFWSHLTSGPRPIPANLSRPISLASCRERWMRSPDSHVRVVWHQSCRAGSPWDTITGAREVFSGEVYDPNFRRGLVFVALYPEIVVRKRHFKPLRIACGRNIELTNSSKKSSKRPRAPIPQPNAVKSAFFSKWWPPFTSRRTQKRKYYTSGTSLASAFTSWTRLVSTIGALNVA